MKFQKHPRQLISAGCSFTDYLANNSTVYGRQLAEKLGCEYLHQGAGAGSNWRIWREVGTGILESRITDQDLVTVQYTGLERREFWTRFKTTSRPERTSLCATREEYPDGGDLIRYKAWSWTWQDNQEENSFFKAYEENHVSIDYELEWFRLQHYQFQLLLQAHNISCVFITGRHRSPQNFDLIDPYDRWSFQEPREFCENVKTWNTREDNSHLSDRGHRLLGDMIYDHIQQL